MKIDQSTKDHLWNQFDKLLVSALLMFAFFLLTHNLKYYISQDSVINQTWGVVTFFLGMLSGLITGSPKSRAGDKPPESNDVISKTVSTITTTSVPPENNNAKTDSGTSANPAASDAV